MTRTTRRALQPLPLPSSIDNVSEYFIGRTLAQKVWFVLPWWLVAAGIPLGKAGVDCVAQIWFSTAARRIRKVFLDAYVVWV
jgi:hypothetical protein